MSSKLRKIAKKRGGQQRPHTGIVEIRNEGQFRSRVLEADKPVIIDFWAPWCGPCKAMAPVFDSVAQQLKGEVVFAKINTEATPSLAQQLNIMSIPTLLVFDGGEIIDSNVGAMNRGGLEAMARRALDKHNGVTTFGKIKRMFGGSANANA